MSNLIKKEDVMKVILWVAGLVFAIISGICVENGSYGVATVSSLITIGIWIGWALQNISIKLTAEEED